ncbi:MAG: hypothetical protein ABS61_14145 [Microbacterium sp. SCN 70-18]|nr:MAG: hypothetical protein ABS61_14145 [Microbacterium sp. SCN 70-18]
MPRAGAAVVLGAVEVLLHRVRRPLGDRRRRPLGVRGGSVHRRRDHPGPQSHPLEGDREGDLDRMQLHDPGRRGDDQHIADGGGLEEEARRLVQGHGLILPRPTPTVRSRAETGDNPRRRGAASVWGGGARRSIPRNRAWMQPLRRVAA